MASGYLLAQSTCKAGSSLRDAAFAALENGVVAVSPTSGFHHAQWAFASSYCTFNGLIVAARALLENTELDPAAIVTKSLEIAGDLCIYTNRNFTLEVLE